MGERDLDTEPKSYSRVLALVVAALLGVVLAKLLERLA